VKKIALRIVSALLIAIAAIGGTIATSYRASASRLVPNGQPGVITSPTGYWSFYNYDAHSVDGVPTNNGTVDDPMTMIYGNNATVGKVSGILSGALGTGSGVQIYADASNGGSLPDSYYTDVENGLKSPPGCGNSPYVADYHTRWYGYYRNGIEYALYDPAWGSFFRASTHEDINDQPGGCSYASFGGWQEDAEHAIFNNIMSADQNPGNAAYNTVNLPGSGSVPNASQLDVIPFNNLLTLNNEPSGVNTAPSSCALVSTLKWSTANNPVGYMATNNECMQSDGAASFVSVQ